MQAIEPQRVADFEIVCKNSFMDTQERDRLLAAIRDFEKATDALRKILQPEPEVTDSEEVAQKLAQRLCLTCGVHVPEGGFYLRGLHQACYNTTMRRIRQGEWSEAERIKSGLLSVGGKPGKQAAIDLAAQKSISEAATKAVNKNIKRLGATKKGRKKEDDSE